MESNFTKLSEQTSVLLGLAKGMLLNVARMTPSGIEMIFESSDSRTEIRFVPNVYTVERVIVDAVNALTIRVRVKKFQLKASGNGAPTMTQVFDEQVELPLSTWLGEDYL